MSTANSPRQTLTFVRERLEAAGVRPKTDLGQNFLIDLNLLRVLADTAQLGPQDVVLEVGTGTGSLTNLLAERAGYVISVEIDPKLHAVAKELVGQKANVRLLCQDALKSKNRFHPAVLEAVEEALAEGNRQFKLVANLPYNVATPVLTNLLSLERPPVTMTATIQKELADRIVARPGSKDYGALSVWIQSQCRARIERTMPPQVFWPRPKVFSAIIHIVLEPERRDRIQDRELFHSFIRGLFLHRRKFLRAQVLSALGRKTDKAAVDEVLQKMGFDPQARAEQLDVESILRLYGALRDQFRGGAFATPEVETQESSGEELSKDFPGDSEDDSEKD
jgi:16S rRNA (adenine1518-N6/adenine1519-N6)-dimethyltransferase